MPGAQAVPGARRRRKGQSQALEKTGTMSVSTRCFRMRWMRVLGSKVRARPT